MKCCLLFFVIGLMPVIPTNAQSTLLKLQIDQVTARDSDSMRTFTIQYQLINQTDRTLKFFLNTRQMRPASTSAMLIYPFYKHFQNGILVDAPTMIRKDGRSRAERMAALQKSIDSISALHPDSTEIQKSWLYSNHQLMNNIVTLKPQQKQTYSASLVWDKNRYIFSDGHEYYLDPAAEHTVELGLILLKEPHRQALSDDQFTAIAQDADFISGWLVSNRVTIDFGN